VYNADLVLMYMIEVSVIVPCLNEENHISNLLNAISSQSYPIDQMEVVIADGMSIDGTRHKIGRFLEQNPNIKLDIIDNEKRSIPSGLNLAISVAKGEYIIRLDAHSIPHDDYIERCISNLKAGRGDNVGGVWVIKPGSDSWIAESIAYAAAHPLGVGTPKYRIGGSAQAVETVPFGAFRRELFSRIGNYNENLLTNEDYELNVRILKAGGIVWFDPAIQCDYLARPSFGSLTKQYWRYGYWKAKMIRSYPGSIKMRQMAAPSLILSVAMLSIIGIIYHLFWWILAAELLFYLSLLGIAGIQSSLKSRNVRLILGVPLAIYLMHIAWGSSFIWSMIKRNENQ
jgi:succinoglycan biosynthesis protein ExoA